MDVAEHLREQFKKGRGMTDLTCQTCKGTGMAPLYSEDGPTVQHFRCLPCNGFGRRLPTLTEWDDLRAERDHYRDTRWAVIDEEVLVVEAVYATREEASAARDALNGDTVAYGVLEIPPPGTPSTQPSTLNDTAVNLLDPA